MLARKPLLAVFIVMTLVTLACGVTIPVQVKTGPTMTDTINVPLLQGNTQSYAVTLSFGAGNFTLKPGAEGAVVSGTATYNVEDFKPKVTINKNVIHVEQGNLKLGGIPNFKNKVRNDWILQLADSPMRLSINGGAYTGRYELGGLSLENLSISDGAADVDLAFSSPNRVDMDTFSYTTGASSVKLTGLANARFAEMKFRSGAGDYLLDFSGSLRFNTNVTIESGLSSITVVVPVGVSARVTFEGGLANVQVEGEWVKNGDQYTLRGSGPILTIDVKMGAGNLKLRNP
jgi:hypothetical protein